MHDSGPRFRPPAISNDNVYMLGLCAGSEDSVKANFERQIGMFRLLMRIWFLMRMRSLSVFLFVQYAQFQVKVKGDIMK